MRMSRHKGLGTLFMAVLLLVIIITNVTMRGLWSVFVILVLIMLTIIFYLAGWWDVILQNVRILAIHINMSGYLLMSIVLFAAWAINFFLMDRQMYMTFTPGQVRARLTIGGGETVYGTTGMSVQKERATCSAIGFWVSAPAISFSVPPACIPISRCRTFLGSAPSSNKLSK